MAVTSLWRISGDITGVVRYAVNPEKTTAPGSPAAALPDDPLNAVIQYAVDQSKTTDHKLPEETGLIKQFVSGINCLPATAVEEMLAVKRRFGKEAGTVAYHGYQSFAEGEVTPEQAHAIGVRLAQALWGQRYQVVVTTHLDKKSHLHNHFVINTVSFLDGKKYYRSKTDYRQMRQLSDTLCRECGLSVVDRRKKEGCSSRQYSEWQAEKSGDRTWRGLVRTDVDEAIRQSMTEKQFFDALKKKGYQIKMGKDIALLPPGKERFVRLARNFGEGYTLDGIIKRILAQTRRMQPTPIQQPRHYRSKINGSSFRSRKKATGFRALYYHYCYLLGIFPKQKPLPKPHFLLREDLRKMDKISAEARLLAQNHIDTAQQLAAYKSKLEHTMAQLAEQRAQLYKRSRTVSVKADPAEAAKIKEQITQKTKVLAQLRRELKLCDDIAVRSSILAGKIRTVRQDEQDARREQSRDVQYRRSSRPGR